MPVAIWFCALTVKETAADRYCSRDQAVYQIGRHASHSTTRLRVHEGDHASTNIDRLTCAAVHSDPHPAVECAKWVPAATSVPAECFVGPGLSGRRMYYFLGGGGITYIKTLANPHLVYILDSRLFFAATPGANRQKTKSAFKVGTTKRKRKSRSSYEI